MSEPLSDLITRLERCAQADERMATLTREEVRLILEMNVAGRQARKWLGLALEQRQHRGDMVDAEGLIEDAWARLEETLNPRPADV